MHWRQKRRAGEEAIRRNWRAKFLESSSVSKSRSQEGKCFLVGAGPGDLGLVTLRAKECIERAEIIIYDYLCNPEILRWAAETAELIFAGKKAGAHTLTQEQINALLVDKTREGKNVVRLKGGDPFLFGRGGEEARALAAAKLPFVIVPGVSSAIAAPAIAIFGEVVNLRDELNWFEGRPLSGKRIVVTRTRKQAGALTEQLRALGADVIELPTIRIEPPTDLRAFAELVQDAHAYDWIVFTSPNGVNAFFEIFYKLYDDAREIGGAKIAAIGPATAQRIKDFHLHVDLQPDEFVAESLAREFRKEGGVENLRILIARAEKARDLLPRELSALGAIVDEGFAYRTVPETRDPTGAGRQLTKEGADLITFTSSSTVENFLALGLPWPQGMRIASIGPITSKTVRDHGLNVDVEARRHDIDGLVQAVRELFAEKG